MWSLRDEDPHEDDGSIDELCGLERPRPREDDEEAAGGGGTVLVVEDEPAVHNLLLAVLAGKGYSVLTAADGDDASRMLGSIPDRSMRC